MGDGWKRAKKAAASTRKAPAKKTPAKKTPAKKAPAQRITKKDLEPDNKAFPPARGTKGATSKATAPAYYTITLIPPAGAKHPDDKRKALKPLQLPSGATDVDRDVAVTRAIQALQACTLKGMRVVVKSPVGATEYTAELEQFGAINQVGKVSA